MTPTISVIIPAFNAAAYIADAIRSIRAQDFAPLEMLLIDDGSTDGTADVARTEAPDARIIRQANAGVAAARNTGLREATGELLCFLDADDGWFPGKIKAQADYLRQHPEVGLVYHRWLVWRPDPDGVYRLPATINQEEPGRTDPAFSGWIYPQLLRDCVVHTSTVMIRRQIARQVGEFDTQLINGEDYDYWLRASRLCEIHKLAGLYSYYRASPLSLTSHPKPINYGYLVIDRAARTWGLTAPDGRKASRADVNQRLHQLAMDFGYMHYRSGSADLAWRAFRTALRHHPLRWRAMFYLFASRIKALRQ
ncbi:glycosyltransferase family 2 protein [Thiocystis violacea]|uniref:glycosyltransferase family 2 protein n=1 Tax=Thiocystis violacea TaxID=13725 RepID=UPI0019072081|nr:glycosyltransferase [Thiocystis violacea]MBK1724689.1 hypothetical protein [Thiocystis violacea]